MENIHKITKLSPIISTANIGDYIIADYCDKVIDSIFGDAMNVIVPTREKISKAGAYSVLSSDVSIVTGTNLLCSDIKRYKQWNIDRWTEQIIIRSNLRKLDWFNRKKLDVNKEKFHIVLMGTGWYDYETAPSKYTCKVLKSLLDSNYLHSVRDSYTEKMLRQAGIHNVVNTACPTMWNLTEDFCKQIPREKAKYAVTTITDYRKDTLRDTAMLKMLLNSYERVWIWLQSFEDAEYIKSLGFEDKLKIIPPTLKAYDDFLSKEDEVDYIGTRLHGGIRALNNKKRTCIIAVDNRALEIGRDTGLPVIQQENFEDSLSRWIGSEDATRIYLPVDNIRRWKNQFSK